MNKKYASCLTTREIEEVLKKAGIQPTAQRIAICKYVLCEAEHTTVDEVKAWADDNFPKISLATVYNTLNILVENGLLRSLKLAHSDKVIFDNNNEDHYHFLDENTGKLYDLMPDQFEIKPKLGNEYQINSMDILIRGKLA